jgi:Na+/H+ antiporter NhaD/arsenite permease-like protein
VSNIGGLLTPLGDPPLFLGYLRGVPFTWTFKLLPIWAVAVGIVLITFYAFDYLAVKKERPEDIAYDRTHVEPIKPCGKINLLFLGGVVMAIIFAGMLEQRGINPSPWRELAMLAMTALSYACTKKELHVENKFSFGPIIEVAVLFAGIFITMVPALLILRERGGEFGITQPWQFFWMSGGLSSFLDNAPTYLTYLSLGQGVTETLKAQGMVLKTVAAQGGNISEALLMAISAGSVCMGANSYIGNGPNFMVKSIAEDTGLKMPSFFGYMAYSCLILLPAFILITFIFF